MFWEDKEMVVYFMFFLLSIGLLVLLYRWAKNVYLSQRFFVFSGGVVVLFVLAFILSESTNLGFDPIILPFTGIGMLVVFSMIDILILFSIKHPLRVERSLPKVFSLGDKNPVLLNVENLTSQKLSLEVIDELPFEFQKRDASFQFSLQSLEEKEIRYQLHPTKRGEYEFGSVNVYMSSFIGFIQRRYEHKISEKLPVYPSLIQMKQMELSAFQQSNNARGLKKIRKIGHSYEFEQIKNYVRGDDYRSINWKATSRSNKLMVNQYEDERSQQVYCIIDKGRNMEMPFNGLSLMDYAVNTTLVISNIALKKHDKVGLMTFSDTIGTTIKSGRKANQLNTILQALYREKERNLESNYELLFRAVRNLISGRSLIFLFTNFESTFAMERVLPLLRKMNRQHLLVVVFFDNTEIRELSEQPAKKVRDIYYKTIAENHVYTKEQIVSKLNQYGIQTILTTPEQLSTNTINKYLELKSRGLL